VKQIRTTTKTVLLTLVAILMQSCYKDDANHHFRIPFKNNTGHSLYVFSGSKEQYLMFPHFQDTILQSYYCDPSKDTLNTKIRPGKEDEYVLFLRSCYEETFGYAYDTLLVFIINADTLEKYGWDSVRTCYKVEQRYDLSLEDLQYLDFKLCFPPSEAMKGIRMWPPYGTYDEEGNVVERRNTQKTTKNNKP